MDKIEKIRQEIKRLREDILSKVHHLPIHRIELLDELASFLDTLSEEPDKNLEEAAIDFADNARKELFTKDYAISSIADYDHGCIDGFIAGAEWQASQMPMPEDTVLFNKGVAEGRRLEREDMMKDGNVILAEEDFDAEKEKSMEWGYNLCKEQMLKDAVEADVNTYELTPGGSAYVEFVVDMPVARFRSNDKVRIVVLKEEEE